MFSWSLLLTPLLAPVSLRPDLRVAAHLRITRSDGLPLAADGDRFGSGLTRLADLDGDGRDELVAGSPRADRGGTDAGVVRILGLQPDGSADWVLEIGEGDGGLLLDPGDNFGESVAAIGDLDGNGHDDLVVSSPGDDDGGSDQGALRVVLLGQGGTVQGLQKISRLEGGFTGTLCCGQVRFGKSVARVGDLDGDGRAEIAVGSDTSQLFLLFLEADGTVRSTVAVPRPASSWQQDGFASELAGPGDVNGDGVPDLLVGAPASSMSCGVFTLLLAADGSVLDVKETAWREFDGAPTEMAPLGSGLAPLGDLDGDGKLEFAMGISRPYGFACFIAPCGTKPDGAWILTLEPDGTVSGEDELLVHEPTDGLGEVGDNFAGSLTPLGDLDGNGVVDLAVGAPTDSDEGPTQGSVWVLFLGLARPGPPSHTHASAAGVRSAPSVPAPRPVVPHKLSNLAGGIQGSLQGYAYAATAIAAIGDLDDDGNEDLAIGTPGRDEGVLPHGALRILFRGPSGSVLRENEIPLGSLSFPFQYSDFGWSLAALGDLDGDGVEDMAAAAPEYSRVWILFLRTDGSVRSSVYLTASLPSLFAQTQGASLARLGDLDGDGVTELAVVDAGDTEGDYTNRLHVVFLRSDGSVKSVTSHSFGAGFGHHAFVSVASLGDLDGDGLSEVAYGESRTREVRVLFLRSDGTLRAQRTHTGAQQSAFGAALAGVGDLDGDGVEDMVVGAPATGVHHGVYWILYLDATGAQRSRVPVIGPAGRSSLIDQWDEFGSALAYLGDPDGDGVPNLAVGARGDDDLRTNSGAVWILNLP